MSSAEGLGGWTAGSHLEADVRRRQEEERACLEAPKLKGPGTAGKKAVVGVKDRKAKKVRAKVVDSTDARTLQTLVRPNVRRGSTVYTDEHPSYTGLQRNYEHDSVAHGVAQYVTDIDVPTNGIESLWSMFKRGNVGTYHRMSFKHLHRLRQRVRRAAQ